MDLKLGSRLNWSIIVVWALLAATITFKFLNDTLLSYLFCSTGGKVASEFSWLLFTMVFCFALCDDDLIKTEPELSAGFCISTGMVLGPMNVFLLNCSYFSSSFSVEGPIESPLRNIELPT